MCQRNEVPFSHVWGRLASLAQDDSRQKPVGMTATAGLCQEPASLYVTRTQRLRDSKQILPSSGGMAARNQAGSSTDRVS
jgi:hypothetical protein